MTKFVGSSRVREGGRPVTHYQDFIAHTGATDWRHKASDIDMEPLVYGSTVQSALEQVKSIIENAGTGFISIGKLNNVPGVYNADDPATPTLKDAIYAAILDSRLTGGGTILLLPGTYEVTETIDIPNGISLIGDMAGTYIVSHLSTDNYIFNILTSSSNFSIGGDSGFGNQTVLKPSGTFQTRFENLIITDNSDGSVNSGNATLSGSTKSMVYLERGANVEFNKVTFIGRLNNGPVLNRIKTNQIISCQATGFTRATSVAFNNCYIDSVVRLGDFSPAIGDTDFLSVKNCKIRFYGEEVGSSNKELIKSTLANIEIENNYIQGAGSDAGTILNVLSTSVSSSTNCSIKISGNSGYSVVSTALGGSKLYDYNYGSSVRIITSSNSWGSHRLGNTLWSIVLGMDEGDVVGSAALDFVFSCYNSDESTLPTIILNPGLYNVTVNSGGFYSFKLEGNQLGRYYPIINLNLGTGTLDYFNNRYVVLGNSLKNIYFKSTDNFCSVHLTPGGPSTSDGSAENITVDNCIFINTNLFIDPANSSFISDGQEGFYPFNGAYISKCTFYQDSTFPANWSFYAPPLDNIVLSDSRFMGAGYAINHREITSGPFKNDYFSFSFSQRKFTVNNCGFFRLDQVDNLPSVGNPYYMDISPGYGLVHFSNSTISWYDQNYDEFNLSLNIEKFIYILADYVSVDNCYFEFPDLFYTNSIKYPVPGLCIENNSGRTSLNINNNWFAYGLFPLKIFGTTVANQNTFYEINNNKFLRNSSSSFYSPFTVVDVEIEGNTSGFELPNVVNFNNNIIEQQPYPGKDGYQVEHFQFTNSSIYSTGAVVQIYASACVVNVLNNKIIAEVIEPADHSLTHFSGIYVNTRKNNSGDVNKFNYVNACNNYIYLEAGTFDLASASRYCSVLHLNSSYVTVKDNYLNFNNQSSSATLGFKGCLVIEGSKYNQGDSIVSGNIFDRRDETSTLRSLLGGYILIDSSVDYRGMIVDNSFTSPYYTGTNTALLSDNTSADNKWVFTRNKNQTVQLTIPTTYGQLGFQNTREIPFTTQSWDTSYLLTVGNFTYPPAPVVLAPGEEHKCSIRFYEENASAVYFVHSETTDKIKYQWSIPLNGIVPLGARILLIDTTLTITSSSPTIKTATLSFNSNSILTQSTLDPISTSATQLSISIPNGRLVSSDCNSIWLDIEIEYGSSGTFAILANAMNVKYIF